MKQTLQSLKILPAYDVDQLLVKEFSTLKGQHYVDHAAATQYSRSQIQAVFSQLESSLLGNPHSRHQPSDAATQAIEDVRQRILEHFNTTADDYDVIFTSGASAALKLVAESFDWGGDFVGEEDDICMSLENAKVHNGLQAQNASDSEVKTGNCINESAKEQREGYRSGCGGAFVYATENHTSVLGMRGPANRAGCRVYSVPTQELQQLLEGGSQNSVDSLCNGEGKPACGNSSCFIEDRDASSFTTRENPSYSEAKVKISERKRSVNCLFAYSGQCNFSGSKCPLSWTEKVHSGALSGILRRPPVNCNTTTQGECCDVQWFVVLDAASLVATSPLDLSTTRPDFVPVSFYKMFGYPTGLGCLLVGRRAWGCLRKEYQGGGTVLMVDSRSMTLVPRTTLHERFEDGTLPFLSILAVRHGLDVLTSIPGGMRSVRDHTFHLARYTHHSLRSLRHPCGAPVALLYCSAGDYWQPDTHGSIVSFNLLDADGSYVGYSQVERVASLYNIHLRTGCLCNPGACQTYLHISQHQLRRQFEAGHVCGDTHDLVDGLPTGSVRVSFGYMSTYTDADQVVRMVRECFIQGTPVVDTTWMVQLNNTASHHTTVGTLREEINRTASRNTSKGTSGSEINGTTSPCTTDGTSSCEMNGIDKIRKEVDHQVDLRPQEELLDSRELEVTDIFIYPVKSCGAMRVDKWAIGEAGLKFDRGWMVVTEAGVTVTQKRTPQMVRISPRVDLQSHTLVLSYQGVVDVHVPLTPRDSPSDDAEVAMCGGRVCGDRVRGQDCGDEVGSWLSQVLDVAGLRLMRQTTHRIGRLNSQTHGVLKESLSLTNESQLLVIHRPSIRHLLYNISIRGVDQELTEDDLVMRFRANLVVDGGVAFEEDTWTHITLDTTALKVQGRCRRCQMVCVSPDTGQRMKEPLLTLATLRGPNITFGVHATSPITSHHSSAVISVGGSVTTARVSTSLK